MPKLDKYEQIYLDAHIREYNYYIEFSALYPIYNMWEGMNAISVRVLTDF